MAIFSGDADLSYRAAYLLGTDQMSGGSSSAVASCVGATCRHAVATGFTDVNALTVLLTTESLLLTVVSLSITLGGPKGRRERALPVSAGKVVAAAVTSIFVVATGAAFAWVKLFAPAFPHDFPSRVIASVIALAIVAEPVYALLLGLGIRTRGASS